MTMSDPTADMITRIRNGQKAQKETVHVSHSRFHENILQVMQDEGFVDGFSKVEENGLPVIEVNLRYYNGQPVIKKMRRVSKPGRRVYVQVSNMPRVANGLGVNVISTSRGVVADHQAKEMNVGGEVLFEIF